MWPVQSRNITRWTPSTNVIRGSEFRTNFDLRQVRHFSMRSVQGMTSRSTTARALVIVLLSYCNLAHADQDAQESADGRGVQSLTATIGEIRFRIDGPKMWTLSGFEFQHRVIAVEDSAYGSVFTLRGVGHLGSAHFLDVPGKPGELEKENVTRVRFLVDDTPLTKITPTMSITGKSFRMERESTVRAISLRSSVEVRDDVLLETVRLTTTKNVDLIGCYPLMYAWTPHATANLFGDDDGVQRRGVFQDASAKPIEGLEKSARWMAIFDAANGKGAVCYLTKHPSDADAWLQYTDAPGVYRKVRVMSFSEKPLPAGFDGTFQAAIAFFTATEADWEASALRRMNELKLRATKVDEQ